MLRDRTLGNTLPDWSSTCENHGEEWLNRLSHYLGVCADFVAHPSLLEPPEPVNVPTSWWLLSVYGRDIISRMDHIKASITSTFGSILKMDSSKKYSQTAVAPPVLLYMDCVEMGVNKLQARFGEWTDLNIRLDIWHFMRWLAAGCTTDTHPLYPTFMGCLSACIFEWDPHDVALLCQAEKEELRQEGVPLISDVLVDKCITKKELALYCRWRTCGEESTTRQKRRDLLCVPLLDRERMEYI
ncbi:hypothetical protein AAFF_G00334410 [Aldrovandia affinis]|uniref:DUF6729 domain-containing protein n=1 Tax=Aldrovandia affinis TaxID=143900 RepID=A0AAD7WPU6_9TELE|nr:hypothetical protein AAFF_G00334410 [Aldrovandia affinis]